MINSTVMQWRRWGRASTANSIAKQELKMKNMIAASLVAVSLVLNANTVEARTTRERCEVITLAQIDGLFANFNTAWATRDPQIVTNLFSPDAILLATVSNTPRTTPDLIRNYFASFLTNSPVGTIDTSTTSLGCNLASRVGTWTVVLTHPETKVVTNVKARYSFIYKFVEGSWKIYHLHSSVMPEPIS
jgi:uncharacterized protein (TIGR02246 family)